MATFQEIQNKILQDRKKVFQIYGLTEQDVETTGTGQARTACPFCGHEDRKFYIALKKPVYDCKHCKRTGNWTQFLREEKDMTREEALHFLSELSGLELSPEAMAKYKQQKRQEALLEAAHEVFRQELKHSEEVQAYLEEERKYTHDEIELMQLGAYADNLKEQLSERGFSEKEMRAAGLLYDSCRRSHKLVLPLEGQNGFINSFAFRDITGKTEPKYLYTRTCKSQAVVGLAQARQARAENIIITEGVLDALHINAKVKEAGGKEAFRSLGAAAVSFGGSDVSKAQMKALEYSGIKYLVLLLDNDKTGLEATEEFIRKLAQKDFHVLVSTVQEYKDIDELLREEGIAGLSKITEAVEWPKYLIERLKPQIEGSDISFRKALDKARKFLLLDLQAADRSSLMKEMSSSFDIKEEYLQDEIEEELEALTQKKQKQQTRELLQTLEKKAESPKAFERGLEESLSKLRESRGVELPHVMTYEEYIDALRSKPEGLRTGFSELDRKCSIDSGLLTIIAGRPSHGKTTLKLNIAKNILERYADKTVLFFSYEVNTENLYTQFILNEAAFDLKEEIEMQAGSSSYSKNMLEHYNDYIQGRLADRYEEIEQAKEKLMKYLREGRLQIFNEAYNSKDLSNVIRSIARTHDAVVFVDYLQKVRASSDNETRYREVAQVSEDLRQAAVEMNIPIIAGAQVKRPMTGKMTTPPRLSDLREAGDIEQDAALVLGLLNEDKARIEQLEQELITLKEKKKIIDKKAEITSINNRDSQQLNIYVLKNRYGAADEKTELNFKGKYSKIE